LREVAIQKAIEVTNQIKGIVNVIKRSVIIVGNKW
jgi:hypothetical protein